MSFFKIIFIFLLAFKPLYSQITFMANEQKSILLIDGTSSIHDWQMTVEKFKSKIELSSNSKYKVNSVSFTIPVISLKSGKHKMEKNTYAALKQDEHTKIIFVSSEIELENDVYYAFGQLTIAGVSKQVKIPFDLSRKDNQFKLTSTYDINMLNYNIDPPRALLGMLKVGENVKLTFDILYHLSE
jgi:polyisoprenoid-binding protein YceI